MGTNYIAPIWRMPRNANKDKFSNYSINAATTSAMSISNPNQVGITSSFSFWLKRPSKTYATRVYNVGTNEQYGWYMYQGGSFIRYNGNYLWPKDDPIGTLPAFRAATEIENEWVHWVITRKEVSATEQNVRIYANGALVYSVDNTTALGTSDSTLSSLLTLANPNNDNLSSFSVYDYELQLSQVQQIYNNATPLNEMALSYGDPVSYYLFGDNANLNAGNTGVAIPNISVGADSVFQFDRSSVEYVKIDGPALNFTDKMSFSAWAKFTSTSQDVYTVAANFDPNTGYKFAIYYYRDNNPSSSYFRVRINSTNNTLQSYTVNGQLDVDRWYHLAFSFDGTTNANGVNLYIDNVKHSFTASNTGIYPNTANGTRIGNYQNNNTWAMIGEISNVQFWDTDLQDSDIATLYNNGQPLITSAQPQAANLQAWYKLNQSANWEADTAGNWQIPDAVSSYPQSFSFDGINDKINLTKPSDWDDNQVHCVSLWLKNEDSNIGYIINSRSGGSVTPGFSFIVNGTSTGYIFSNTITSKIATGYQSDLKIPNDGKWHHVLWTHQPITNVLKAYINGVYKYTFTGSSGTDSTSSIGPIIGDSGGAPWKGKISNIMAWEQIVLTDGNVAIGELAENQVAEVYNNGVPLESASVATSNLKLWAKLDNTELFDGTNWSVENQKYPASYESALKFPGTSNGTGISFLPLTINVTQANTYSAWIYPISQTSFWTIIAGAYSGSTPRIGPISLTSAGGSNFAIRSTQRSMNTASRTVTSNSISNNELGKWHHVMVVVNNLDVSFYLNGQPHGTATFNDAWTSSTIDLFSIGQFSNWVPNGYMSNIAIWDSDQSANIANIYNNGTPQNSYTVEPIALWKLDNTTTGLNDIIGGKNGTLSGNIVKVNTFVSTEAATSSGMTEQNLVNNNVSALNGESSGMNTTNLVTSNLTRKQPYSNYSFNFDQGASDYFNCSNVSVLQNASVITWNLWVNFARNDFNVIFGKALNTTDVIQFYTWGAGRGYFWLKTAGSPVTATIDPLVPGTVPLNEWAMFTIVFDGSQSGNDRLKIYLNGGATNIITSYSSTPPATLPNTTDDFFIGRGYNGYFDGKISNLAIWDSALTFDDINNLYNNGVPQNLNNFRIQPVNWWPLDENSSYYGGADWITRDVKSGQDGDGNNTGNVDDLVGNAPGSEGNVNAATYNMANNFIAQSQNSNKNAYSINMADYASDVTNPASSGRSTEIPTV